MRQLVELASKALSFRALVSVRVNLTCWKRTCTPPKRSAPLLPVASCVSSAVCIMIGLIIAKLAAATAVVTVRLCLK